MFFGFIISVIFFGTYIYISIISKPFKLFAYFNLTLLKLLTLLMFCLTFPFLSFPLSILPILLSKWFLFVKDFNISFYFF